MAKDGPKASVPKSRSSHEQHGPNKTTKRMMRKKRPREVGSPRPPVAAAIAAQEGHHPTKKAKLLVDSKNSLAEKWEQSFQRLLRFREQHGYVVLCMAYAS